MRKVLFFIVAGLFTSSITFANDMREAPQGNCPDGGIPSEKAPSVCCKDGFMYVGYQKDYTSISYKFCGYPKEGYKPKGDVESWCKDGYRLSPGEKSFSWLRPNECGCPDGSEYHEGKYVGHCCKDGYELHDKGKFGINFEICGCPKGTKHAEYNICCLENKKGYAIKGSSNELVPEKLDIWYCGCPENGKFVRYGLKSYACCKDDGYILDEKSGLYDKKGYPCRNILIDFFVESFRLLY